MGTFKFIFFSFCDGHDGLTHDIQTINKYTRKCGCNSLTGLSRGFFSVLGHHTIAPIHFEWNLNYSSSPLLLREIHYHNSLRSMFLNCSNNYSKPLCINKCCNLSNRIFSWISLGELLLHNEIQMWFPFNNLKFCMFIHIIYV